MWKVHDDVVFMYPGQARLAFPVRRHFVSSALGNFIILFLDHLLPFTFFVLFWDSYLVRCSDTAPFGVILYFSLFFFFIFPLCFRCIYWKTSPILSSSSSLNHILAIFMFFKFPQAPSVFSNHSFYNFSPGYINITF